MKRIFASVRLMTYDEQQQWNVHTRGLVLEHQGHSYALNAGTSDRINVFTESVCLYVLTVNMSLDYVGLDAYMAGEPDPVNTVFLHTATEITETLGKRWQQMNPQIIANRLKHYLI